MEWCLDTLVGAIFGPVFSYAVEPVRHELEYLFSYTDKKGNLQTQVLELDAIRRRIDREAEQARNKGNSIWPEVRDWQNDATTKSEQATHFLERDRDHRRATCSCRWPLPNLPLRRRLSKEAEEIAKEVAEEIKKANYFGNDISFRPPVEISFEQKDFAKFETRELTLSGMMEALRNPEVRMIGLCGIGGMGKTTLVKEVARQAKEGNLFSKQIMAVVSQHPNIEQIQQEIADQLGLTFKKDAVSTRAERLREKLKQGPQILLVLDDVWKDPLDVLSEVGIPFEGDNKECKIILTSRSQEVCKAMGADEKTTFEVKGLNDEEARDLFNRIVGDVNRELESLKIKVVRECGGLPLAIVTIASALKYNQTLPIWRNALRELQRSPAESEIYGKIRTSLKTSFDVLGDEPKSLLLICSAYEEDANVSLQELTGYVMALDSFRNVDALNEASDRLESLVNNLKAYCLLSDGNYPGTVKVHDVIRDVAIKIASELEKNPMYCLRENVSFKEDCLKRENFKDLYAISVPEGGAISDQLPERLACPRLQLLMLRSRSALEIPDEFFEETKELKALRLNWIDGKQLAPSFRSLQNLKALRLRIWNKKEDVDIAVIGELKNLVILDLSLSSGPVLLPKEIGNLRRLQVLNLNDCYRIKVIEPNVISSLAQLEELYMEGVGVEWETEGLSEIKHLEKLRVLHLRIRDGSVVPEDMFHQMNLERYRILIGEWFTDGRSELRTRVLRVDLRNDSSQLLYEDGFQKLMKKSDELRLRSFPVVSHLIKELDASCSFQDLECLDLQNLENPESFMLTSPPTRSPLFNHEVAQMSFKNLQELDISCCDNVQCLLSFAMVESLKQLRKLRVSHCKNMEEIVTKAVGEDGRLRNISFPELESLKLQDLPKLKRFCEGDCIECPSLLQLQILNSSDFRTFIPNSQSTTTLQVVEKRQLVAQQPLFNEKVVLMNLTELVVWHCPGLTNLFSSSTATSLAQLKRVFIGECDQMTQVIHVNDQMDNESAAKSEIVLGQLKIFALHRLGSLRCFHNGNNKLKFPKLEKIIVSECPEMESFSHGTVNAPNLNRRIVAKLDTMPFYLDMRYFFGELKAARPTEELWEGDLNRTIRKLWEDSGISLQWLFSETAV